MTMSTVVLNSKNFNQTEEIFNGKKNKNNNYKLRDASLKKREEMEHRKNQPRKRGPKPRPKTAPMSKYRRKTANLRERLRMGEINVAFEKLRDKLPNPMAQAGKAKCEKLTKINILHVAINYIRAMENLLETGDSGVQSFSEMTKNPLRDEADKKIEMQRVLATLMSRADKVHHQARSKRKSKRNFDENDESSSSSEDEELDEMEEENAENEDLENLEDEEDPCPQSIYEAPITDTSWTSSDSGISEPAPVPTLCTSIVSQNNNSSDPMLCTSTTLANHHHQVSKSLQNPHHHNPEDFMDFTDLEDLMDTLHGMPKIDFEDNFEMFP